MTDDEIEAIFVEAEESWQGVTLGDPEDCEWGFFSYGDAPAAIGGGTGMFAWFPDRESMFEFIATTLPFNPPGRSDLDPFVIAENTAQIVKDMECDNITLTEGVQRLNQALKTCSQIEWMGTVEDLLAGNHPYAIEVRNAYHDGEKEHGAPISSDEKLNFCQFIQDWGL